MSQPKIIILLLIIFTACGCQVSRSSSQEVGNEAVEDPSVKFSQELTFLEPPAQKRLTNESLKQSTAFFEQDVIELPKITPLEVKGDINLSGNTDINSLNDLIYKRFVQEGYSGVINFSGIDSDQAIKLFCEGGEFDILTVSRPMNENESATCKANDRQPLNFPITKDALVIVVHRQDTFIKNLTLPKLQELFQVENWSDVNPNWPDQTIERFLITPKTFLFDTFPEKFQSEGEEPMINSLNTNLYKFYQPLSQELSTTRYGLGYLSYPYYWRNSKFLRAVPIEGQVPNTETVQNGTYPFSYSIFLYTDINRLQQKPQVSAFINFYLTHVNQEIDQVGYLPLSEQELNESKSNWLKEMDQE